MDKKKEGKERKKNEIDISGKKKKVKKKRHMGGEKRKKQGKKGKEVKEKAFP